MPRGRQIIPLVPMRQDKELMMFGWQKDCTISMPWDSGSSVRRAGLGNSAELSCVTSPASEVRTVSQVRGPDRVLAPLTSTRVHGDSAYCEFKIQSWSTMSLAASDVRYFETYIPFSPSTIGYSFGATATGYGRQGCRHVADIDFECAPLSPAAAQCV